MKFKLESKTRIIPIEKFFRKECKETIRKRLWPLQALRPSKDLVTFLEKTLGLNVKRIKMHPKLLGTKTFPFGSNFSRRKEQKFQQLISTIMVMFLAMLLTDLTLSSCLMIESLKICVF